MRVAIYSRFSSHLQREASIEDQVRLCRERAAKEGWTVCETFADRGISGASLLRPGLQGLIEGAMAGRFEVVLAEALDRLSRDQADVAALYKRLMFAGVQVVTLSEGEINELHVGLKGTMNQLFLKDLADKTRRGLRGRVEDGHSGGGNSYGYDVVRRLGDDGQPVKGERTVNASEARTVRRIFAAFADGQSPKAIAKQLNEEGIPGPRSSLWRDTAIRGHRTRGTGLLNNELYIGRLVWNRQRYVKDPATGRRVSRLNASDAWVITEVPKMRLVADEIWDRVKHRQGEIEADPRVTAMKATRFWEKRRAQHLLTGLLFCGACGGGFASVGRDYVACSAARKLGTCNQRRSIRRNILEEAVLGLLRDRLMQPDAVAEFISAFGKEMNARRVEESITHTRLHSERAQIARKVDGLYDAIAEGLRTPGLKQRLEELEARLQDIDAAVLATPPSPVRLHPNLAELYKRKVATLAETLTNPEIRVQAVDSVRVLIDRVTLNDSPEGLTIELEGALSAMISAAQPEAAPLMKSSSVKVVAGTGFEPVTFRL